MLVLTCSVAREDQNVTFFCSTEQKVLQSVMCKQEPDKIMQQDEGLVKLICLFLV